MIVPLAKIADIQTGPFGSQLHEKDYVEGEGTPIVTVEHLGERRFASNNLPLVGNIDYQRLAKYTMRPGDIIFSRVGSVERCSLALPENDGWLFSGRCLRVRPKKGVDSNYLYAYLSAPAIKKYIRSIAVGATMPSINTSIMGEIPIRVPTYEKQRSIGFLAVLFDKKIEVNQRINGYLADLADAIFKERCATPEANATLSDIAEVTMGQSPRGSSYNETHDGTVFYQGRGEFGCRFPIQRLYTTEPKRMARKNDVLMSVRAPVGDLNVAYEDCCIGRGLASIHSSYPSFCLYLMRSLRTQLDSYNGEGTVFGSINGKALKALPIGLPDGRAIKDFERLVGPLDAEIRSNETESRRLAALRDSLLPKLMSGEIDVSKVEVPTPLNSHLCDCLR
jgi:type I restriction enzyme S subunit